MKKILALILIFAMLFSLVACGGKDDEDKTPSSSNNSSSNSNSPSNQQTQKPSNTPVVDSTETEDEKSPEETAEEIASGFGSYNGQPIVWRVLDIDLINERVLLISRDCIDEVLFLETEPSGELTWESSDLRKWLGGEFYDTAFTEEQKGRILEVTNPADTNSEFGVQGGNDTTDKVFILSASEMVKYFADDADMAGTLNGEGISYWTRTPGDSTQGYVCIYSGGGGLYMTGNWATSTGIAVRPTIWVNLSDEADAANSSTPEQGNNEAASGEVNDFTVGIEGVPVEWQKGIGEELYGMEVSADGSDFSTGYLQKFGNVASEDYVTYKAYFDSLEFDFEADGVYNCDWGQLQISHNADGSELTVSWYVN